MSRVEVEFHSHLADPLDHATRLVRKALRAGRRVCVASPQWEAFSRHLWVFEAGEFLAHARPGAPAAVWRRSALWLVAEFANAKAHDAAPRPGVWVNLGADAPSQLEGCERLIELVSRQPEAIEAGRERWRCYRADGLVPVVRFDGRAGEPEPRQS